MNDRMIAATQLPRAFYQRDAVTVARALLGQRLVRIIDGERIAGIIVETEAYLGEKDKAAHTFNGRRTQRNASMWLGGGHAYVYFTYGMHYCMNVVAGRAEQPVAVLLRALEPTEGLDAMRSRRRAARRDTDLCSGPAKLCEALAIDRGLDGHDLTDLTDLTLAPARAPDPAPDRENAFFIERRRQRAYPARQIVAGPRVGVHYAEDWADAHLRFTLRGSPYVSRGR